MYCNESSIRIHFLSKDKAHGGQIERNIQAGVVLTQIAPQPNKVLIPSDIPFLDVWTMLSKIQNCNS